MRSRDRFTPYVFVDGEGRFVWWRLNEEGAIVAGVYHEGASLAPLRMGVGIVIWCERAIAFFITFCHFWQTNQLLQR
jgi:hypothetical protein